MNQELSWMIFVFVTGTVLLIHLGQFLYSKYDTHKSEPDEIDTRKYVPCGECKGSGKVSYTKDNILVQLGLYEEGKEYLCPMCGGDREFWVEDRRSKM